LTLNQRQSRSFENHVRQVVDRLRRHARTGNRGYSSFAAICDMISIPHDLRAALLTQLVHEGYVTREGDRVRLTAAGEALVASPPT
jgi:predicted methyltransferase